MAWGAPPLFEAFVVQRATDLGTGSPPPSAVFADIATHVSNFRYDDTGVTSGQIYWYRVATELGGVRGPFTAPVPYYTIFLSGGS